MIRKTRFAGIEFSLSKTEDGFHFDVKSNPEHIHAREEIFSLFDQLQLAARRSGVTNSEIVGHWIAGKLRRNPTRPR